MKKTITREALRLAIAEAGAGRNVMLLFPDRSWIADAPLMAPLTVDPHGSRGTDYTRCTTCHSGLKSVAIDTLILVSPDISTWDAEGEEYAHECLRTSTNPRVIKVGEKAC